MCVSDVHYRYDPVDAMAPADTVIEEDRELLEDFYGLEEDVNYDVLTPWLLRLILDDRLTVDKKLGMGQIADKLKDEFEVGGGGITVECVWASAWEAAGGRVLLCGWEGGDTAGVAWRLPSVQCCQACLVSYLWRACCSHTRECVVLCCATLQGLLDVIAADDNAPVKVLRLRIKDEASNQGGGANMLTPMEGEDLAACAPPVDDATVGGINEYLAAVCLQPLASRRRLL